MRTVTQLFNLLGSYMAPGLTTSTHFLVPLNQVQSRFYKSGNYKELEVDFEADVSSGYICLPPDYECILLGRINDVPIDIRTMKFTFQKPGPGTMTPPVGNVYGIIDQGWRAVMSDLPEDGLAGLTFTTTGGTTWASGDAISVTYTTASHGRLTTSITLTPSGTTATLTPLSNITDFTAITHTGLPDRVLATYIEGADTITYAILLPGDGTARFRRYQVPQVPLNTTDDWTMVALVKRAWIPLVGVNDFVYLDNDVALKYGLLAVIQDDQGNHEEGAALWKLAIESLNDELTESRGGAQGLPVIELHGKGIPALNSNF